MKSRALTGPRYTRNLHSDYNGKEESGIHERSARGGEANTTSRMESETICNFKLLPESRRQAARQRAPLSVHRLYTSNGLSVRNAGHAPRTD